MESWTERIEAVLERAPTRALSVSRLLEELKAQNSGPVGGPDMILNRMCQESERFKVVPDRLGPWAHPVRIGERKHSRLEVGTVEDPWIFILRPPRQATGWQERLACRVQECLQAWGENLDTGCQRAVARWIVANREAQETLSGLFSPDPRTG